jgi:hypothetical protein
VPERSRSTTRFPSFPSTLPDRKQIPPTIDGEELLYVVLPSNKLRVIRLIGKGTEYEVEVGDDPYWVTSMGER